jgi:class 3 adenylate cyclase/serine/threonine protein kinase
MLPFRFVRAGDRIGVRAMELQTRESRVPSPRLAVVMFTDLVNSSDLKRRLGPEAYGKLMERHDALIRRAMAAAPTGRVLQDTGDGYLISFDSIGHAVSAALIFQWLMAHERWEHPFASRVGLHLGEVNQAKSQATGQAKFISSAIDVASRTMSLACGGQILLTRAVFDAARQVVREHPEPSPGCATPSLRWVAHGPYLFKGAREPVEVFEVGAEGTAPLSVPPDSDKARRHLRPHDEETLGWRPAVGRSLENSPNWLLTEKLGEGGFGEVWLAEHVKTRGRRVFKFCFDSERLRALKREVVLFRLMKEALGDRRDIASVKDWQLNKPPYFIETDYTSEGNLAQWAERQGGIDRVPLDTRLRMVAQIAEALAAAHSVGILHKNIKPSNVLISEEPGSAPPLHFPRLTDFGIGMLTDRRRLGELNITATGFTSSNIVEGREASAEGRMYCPPERLVGRPHTVQGDLYGLGVLLYQMAIGDLRRPLAMGWERDVGDELLREDIAACVEGDPSRRLPSCGELVARLNTLEQRRRSRVQERTRQRRSRWVRVETAALAVLTVLVVLLTIAYLRERRLRLSHEKHLAEAPTSPCENFAASQCLLV